MPQISQLAATYSSQIFWLLIFFGFIYFVIGRRMVPQVMATMDARDNQIAADLAAAEAARDAADKEEEAWRVQANNQRNAAQELIARAKAEAAKASEIRLAATSSSIDARIAEAETRIESARSNAVSELETVASEAAQDIVNRLTGTSIDADAARAAVKEAMHG